MTHAITTDGGPVCGDMSATESLGSHADVTCDRCLDAQWHPGLVRYVAGDIGRETLRERRTRAAQREG